MITVGKPVAIELTEVTSWIMSPIRHAPIVLMTASFEGESETARQLIGAVGVISKPFDLDDLLDIVSQFSPCIS